MHCHVHCLMQKNLKLSAEFSCSLRIEESQTTIANKTVNSCTLVT